MKLGHIYSDYFYRSETTGDVYLRGNNFAAFVWQRYLDVFDHVHVFGRYAGSDISNKTLSSAKNVQFTLFDYFKYPVDALVKTPSLLKTLHRFLDTIDCAIIRVPCFLGYLAEEICVRRSIPYAMEVVGCAWDALWNYGSLRAKLLAPLGEAKQRKGIRRAPFAIYATQQYLQRRYPSNGITSHASNVFLPSTLDIVLDQRIGKIQRCTHKVSIGMLANLSVRFKGFDVFFNAVSRVKSQLPNFTIQLAGGGEPDYVNSLARRHDLTEHVKLLGVLNGTETVFSFLDSIDLYIHPSKQEGLPRAVIEAMSRGCPVLASSVAGTPELIDMKYLHQPGDSKTLSEQLVHYLGNTAECEDMATKNFNRAKDYELSVITNRRRNFLRGFMEYAKDECLTTH